MSKRANDDRVEVRRARFREAVARLGEKAQSTELLRMLLLPGAFALVLGFVFMFFGWYGAARTSREIEQVPYLISGGFIGLGLVFVGGLLLASAFWMSMLQRFSEDARDREDARSRELEQRLRQDLGGSRTPSRRTRARRP